MKSTFWTWPVFYAFIPTQRLRRTCTTFYLKWLYVLADAVLLYSTDACLTPQQLANYVLHSECCQSLTGTVIPSIAKCQFDSNICRDNTVLLKNKLITVCSHTHTFALIRTSKHNVTFVHRHSRTDVLVCSRVSVGIYRMVCDWYSRL